MNKDIEKNLRNTFAKMSDTEKKECKQSEENGKVEMAQEMLEK